MIELPESYTLSKQLKETVLGKTIKRVAANTSPHGFAFYFGDPKDYNDRLAGKTIDGVAAYGRYVEMCAGDMRLTFGDGVNIRFYMTGVKMPVKHQLLIDFTDGDSLVCTVQMYGEMQAFPEGANQNFYYLVARDKPSPLTEDFSQKYFEGLLKETKKTASTKAFLATEQRIPGLGNGSLQDILFNARINPRRKINELKDGELDLLFKCVKETLTDMTAKGGRDTEKDIFGEKGGYKTILSSKTYKSPCPACGGSIIRQAFLGGNVYFCPDCQPIN